MSTPDKRPIALDTMNEIKKEMSKITRKENVDAGASLTTDFRNPDNWKARVEQTQSMKTVSVKADAIMVQQKTK